MDAFLFHIPVVGISAWMFLNSVKIKFHHHHLFLYIDDDLILYTAFYTTHNVHKQVIEHLLRLGTYCPFLMEKTNPYKYIVSLPSSSLFMFTDMLKKIFSCDDILLEMGVSNNLVRGFGSCSFHLLDLYEMGYMTRTPIVLHHPRLLPLKTQPHIFTGLTVRARNPYQRYPYDVVELDFCVHTNKEFLNICLDTMLHDRPDRMRPTTIIVSSILKSIPFKSPHVAKKTLRHWKGYQELKVDHRDISISHWKPGVFLKDLSKLLDIFPSYFIDYRFNLELGV